MRKLKSIILNFWERINPFYPKGGLTLWDDDGNQFFIEGEWLD